MRLARVLVLLAALACLPSLARAYVYGPYGVNIRWDQCFGDGGPQNKNFACDTNTGSGTLVGSFVPAWDIVNVDELEIVIDIAFSGSNVPPWWLRGNSALCRGTPLTVTTTDSPAAFACPSWSGEAQVAGGIGAYDIGARGPNTIRMIVLVAVPPGSEQALTGRDEYFGFNIVINHARTVGTNSCAGCTTPACMVFEGLRMVTTDPVSDRYLTGPSNLTDSNYATWQGGGVPVVGGQAGCPAATPTLQRTWGAVKALYH